MVSTAEVPPDIPSEMGRTLVCLKAISSASVGGGIGPSPVSLESIFLLLAVTGQIQTYSVKTHFETYPDVFIHSPCALKWVKKRPTLEKSTECSPFTIWNRQQ